MIITQRLLLVLMAVASWLLLSPTAGAEVLHVPAEYPTIQSAVDAAEDGDKVRVAPGIYAESVTWTGKDIRLIGAGPDETIVDPSLGPEGRCFTLIDVPDGAVARGFTCQHGFAVQGSGGGGGMLIQNGSLTIRDFVFTANTSRSGGGGVSIQGGSPVFEDVLFQANIGDFSAGGGMRAVDADVTLKRCVFDSNLTFESSGGGIASTGTLALVDCTFFGNGGSGGGGGAISAMNVTATRCSFENNAERVGGAVAGGGTGTFVECSFHGNESNAGFAGSGGAIVGFADLRVERCDFSGNEAGFGIGGAIRTGGRLSVVKSSFTANMAERAGGAIDASGETSIVDSIFRDNTLIELPFSEIGGGALVVRGNAEIVNTVFFGNRTVFGRGGGLLVTGVGAVATVIHCTFTRNVAAAGGAVAVDVGASATIKNSILFGNTGGEIDAQGTVVVIHSLVQGGFPGCGNIDADPLFVDAGNGDLHVQRGSPAIDAGMFFPGLPTHDLDGRPRVLGSAPDMGAYERACNGPH